MARTKPEKKTPARNFILEPKVKNKGRGKNKVEVVEGVTKTRLQSRLYCVPVFQGPIRKIKKNAKFECFTDIEAAQKAMRMPSTPLPAVSSKGRKKSSAAQEYATELRKLLAEMQAASPGPGVEYPVLPLPPMKGLRGTPAEHTARAEAADRFVRSAERAASMAPAGSFDRARLDRLRDLLQFISSENHLWAKGTPRNDLDPTTYELLESYDPRYYDGDVE